MLKSVSLDLFLLNKYAQFVDAFCDTFTEQVAFHVNFVDCFAKGSYSVSFVGILSFGQNYSVFGMLPSINISCWL